MAFPDTIDSFVQAVDPSTTTDAQNITQYQTYLASGNFAEAQNILASMAQGIQMNMNAGRFNAVMNAVVAIETFYQSLAGVRQYFLDNIGAYGDINLWDSETAYNVGRIASDGSQWYLCTQANTNIEPNVAPNWADYWSYFLQQQPAKQYPIQATQPTGQSVGDLWVKVITQ